MASKRKAKRPSKRPDRAADADGETRAAEAVTVAWMLSTLATTVALVLALAALAFMKLGAAPAWTALFAGLLTYVAIASGLMALLLTVPVLRLRRERPPAAITLFAVASGLAPWVLLAALHWAA